MRDNNYFFMNDVSSTTFSDRDKWNENYLAVTFLEDQDFFARNGTKNPLTNILSNMFPFYNSRTAYLKSRFRIPKINPHQFNSSLKEISQVIDNLDLLTDDEEAFFYDKSYFFTKNFGSLYELSNEIEIEHEQRLHDLRLLAFLKGDTTITHLKIDYSEIQRKLNENKLFNKPNDMLGLGSTFFLLSNLNFTRFYENELGLLAGSGFLGVGTLFCALDIYKFEQDNSYLYLREKCERADKLIEDIIKK